MSNIYLICSAESEAEPYRIAQGHFDTGLTERGQRQLKALERRFQSVDLDVIFASDRYRARATANAVRGSKKLPCLEKEALRDVFLGPWEGQNWGNIAYDQCQAVSCFSTAPGKWNLGGAEPPAEAAQRLLKELRRIAAEHAGQTVAVVSHRLIIQLALALLKGTPLEDVQPLPSGQATAISILSAEADGLRLLAENDTAHLADPTYLSKESPRQKPDFNTDLYIQPLHWVEYSGAMAQAVECVWAESGEDRPFDANRLIGDAALFPTTIAYAEYEPAGFLQMGVDPSWITLICTHPGCRSSGLGAQLIGRAVLTARRKGLDELHIALPPNNPYRDFFLHQGFIPDGADERGRQVLTKGLAL